MSRFVRLSALLLPTIFALTSTAAAQTAVSGRRLLVDGSVYVVRGVNFSPTPAGAGPNTGYSLFTDTQSWTNDFKLIKAMGANTIRLQDATDATQGFLDAASASGLKVVMGYYVGQGWDITDGPTQTFIAGEVLDMVNAWKAHPAVLMWSVGNEVTFNNASAQGSPGTWYSFLNTLAGQVKAADPDHPVTTAVAETTDVTNHNASVPNLDLWGVNLYRGPSFGNAFTTLSGATAKPVWFSEFGADAYNTLLLQEDQDSQADAIVAQWGEIEENLSGAVPGGILTGGAVFEWSDEWWKGAVSGNFGQGGLGGYLVQDSTADWSNGAYTWDFTGGNNMQEEWWGIVAISSTAAPAKRARGAYHALRRLWNPSSAGGAGPVFSGAVTAAPNPVAPGASTTFYIPVDGAPDKVDVSLLDASYRKVTDLSWADGLDPQGNPACVSVWDGRVNGDPAQPGVYLLRASVSVRDREEVAYRRVVVVP